MANSNAAKKLAAGYKQLNLFVPPDVYRALQMLQHLESVQAGKHRSLEYVISKSILLTEALARPSSAPGTDERGQE